jgi:alkanesulfonate monooxygenase SsuD/methylene tetrahydromethanopterin reductase-like flavin-dependent oxidoreductase (luciferase family)
VLERSCEKIGRDPATVWRSLGLYALCGHDQADLERRFARMRHTMPAGVVNGTVDEWREGRLVGTVDEIRAQRDQWEKLGVETLIVGAGPLPFSITALDDVEVLAHALVTS